MMWVSQVEYKWTDHLRTLSRVMIGHGYGMDVVACDNLKVYVFPGKRTPGYFLFSRSLTFPTLIITLELCNLQSCDASYFSQPFISSV